MTDILEGDKYITLHFVWTTYIEIKELLAANDQDEMNDLEGEYSMVSEMKKLGRLYVIKNDKDMAPTFEHKAMTFLSPMYKKLIFVDNRERYQLQIELEDYLKLNYPEIVQQNEDSTVAVTSISHAVEPAHNKFVSLDHEIVGSGSEIDRYINHPVISNVDTAVWWHANGNSYPSLYKLFKELSCIPATSASSERDFSLAGNIITDKRSMLLPENVNDLILARNIL